MQRKKIEKLLISLIIISLFTVLGTNYLKERGRYHTRQQKTIEDPEFRRDFFSDSMRQNKEELSEECKTFLENVENDVDYYPIPESIVDNSENFLYRRLDGRTKLQRNQRPRGDGYHGKR